MILMKGFVFIIIAAMEMGKRQWLKQQLLRGKNALLGNSMQNHSGYVTLTTRTFLKFLPLLGIIKI